jgi:hypothetical protein
MPRAREKASPHEKHSATPYSVEWYTPPEIFEALGIEFTLDPASPPGGLPWIPARRHFSVVDDGLAQEWSGRVWLNPPYGRDIGAWTRKLAEHGDGIALVFARTETRWFQEAIKQATAACFLKGRLKFVSGERSGPVGSAPAPSVLLAYGVSCAIALANSDLGSVVLLPKARSFESPR